MNIQKNIELYTFCGWTVWYVNYMSIKIIYIYIYIYILKITFTWINVYIQGGKKNLIRNFSYSLYRAFSFCQIPYSSVIQSCLSLCGPMDCSLPGSSVHGLFQARIMAYILLVHTSRTTCAYKWPHYVNFLKG